MKTLFVLNKFKGKQIEFLKTSIIIIMIAWINVILFSFDFGISIIIIKTICLKTNVWSCVESSESIVYSEWISTLFETEL